MVKKWVYLFTEGDASMRSLLGGKGAGVAEMTKAGLPVPPGLTITTEASIAYYAADRMFPEGLWDQVQAGLKDVEARAGKEFGDPTNPLLVSVRSGARDSMPGMMDTVLNLGLNAETLKGVIAATGNDRFAYDSFRRFIQMFSKIVLDIPSEKFELALQAAKDKHGAKYDTDLTAANMKSVAEDYLAIVEREAHRPFPSEPLDQLRLAIEAVFRSWNNDRAITYRNFHKIPHDLGTGVNVQTMAFGNMGGDSGTGVAFTRDPNTGERVLYGEYLINAQGEDVVAGIRTPRPIASMERDLPQVYRQFVKIADQMERHYKDMQDLEFTVERGRLYMLQTRSGKRAAAAAVRIAVEMAEEGLIDKTEAVRRVEPTHVESLLHRQIDPKAKVNVIARGLNASPGAAVGKAVFDSDRAEEMAKAGDRVVLVRQETNPDDVHGMIVSQGILTARGGATSHAAVVARQIGKPCVAGCEALRVDAANRCFTIDGVTVHEGDEIAINGTTGEVILGAVPLIEPTMSDDLKKLLGWADELRRLKVWANADYPRDAEKAREYGAQGIGLCRTEHMFFEEERLPIVRRMILAEKDEERERALAELLPIQRNDFRGIFKAMDGHPVVIRLIDPPLHEFLPHYDDLLVDVTEAKAKGHPDHEKEALLATVGSMREANPMLGLRGCRLGILYPGIVRMQVRAILEAAADVSAEGVVVHPEIMIPLISHVNELKVTRDELEGVARQVQAERGRKLEYKFGTMIEVPRAALTADEIAEHAEFFSFGTNDLTQTTFAISRDDAEGKFLLQYVERGILPVNPFQSIDRKGVGKLMRMAVESGRATRADLEVGICGEHGGDPSSVEFCHEIGLDYVSCSPFRVPVARLAAAQAAIAPAVRDR
ncbi:MAG: pyruvate, phosphate dikinase [Chloroflexota bacterium]|nr:MAG: pyruvate, phosphate dikinase [Chloroflexota bacterium]